MKINITLSKLQTLLRNELGEQYQAFEQSMALKLYTKRSVFSESIISSQERNDALLSALTDYSQHLSATMKMLIGWIDNTDFYKYSQRPNSTNKIPPPRGEKIEKPSLKPAGTKIPNEVPPESLSRKKTKQITKWMKTRSLDKTGFYCCKVENCKICQQLFVNVPLTRCNHDKPHNDVGVYPHLNRKLVRKCHAVNNIAVTLALKGLPNPLLPKTTPDQMEVVPVEETHATKRKRVGQNPSTCTVKHPSVALLDLNHAQKQALLKDYLSKGCSTQCFYYKSLIQTM